MRKSFKNCWLLICLLSTLAMVGCGGGGGSNINPASPKNPQSQASNEALAARAAVTPILQNADTILGLGGGNASFRTSISGNVKELNTTEIGNSVLNSLQTPQFLRAVISEIGGNIDSGLWENESRAYFDIATFSNNVYERSVFDDYYNNEYGLPDLKVGYIRIEGCSGELSKDNVLTSLSVKSGAKITFYRTSYYGIWNSIPASFTGTINSDFSVKWEGKDELFDSPILVDRYGNENDFKTYEIYRTNHKLTSKATYSFSNSIKLHLDKLSYVDDDYYSGDIKEYEANLDIAIDGIKEFIDTKTVYCDVETKNWEGEWGQDYRYRNIVTNKRTDNLKYTLPISVTFSGNVSVLTPSYDSEGCIDGDDIKSGSIKYLTIKINKMSGDFDTLVIDDAEAYIEPIEYKSNKAFKIGNHDVDFNEIKINVTGLKYNYNWKKHEALYNNCYTNAIASFTAKETNKNVVINGNCDIKAKTAKLLITNNGEYIVKESTNDKLLEFNFKTVEINGTNVDILANNKCEGALLEVTGVEKDDLKTTSVRNYKVVNGKLVLISSNDKKIPNLPDVEISPLPEGLEDDSNSIEVAVSEAKEDLKKPEAKKPTKDNDPNESLKVVDKNGKKVGHYEKKASNNAKKVDSNITAKDKIICSVTFYGDNEYTIVFIIDYTNSASPAIKGSIFNGMRNNVTMDTVENRIGIFAGKNGKITVITSEGSSEVSVQ